MRLLPICCRPKSTMPGGAPGATDHATIFIRDDVDAAGDDILRATLRHEYGHVYLHHRLRGAKWCGSTTSVERVRAWIIGCELEIARTIYDHRDMAAIAAPRSPLSGGYVPDCEIAPGISIAEQIADWILAHPEAKELLSCGGGFEPEESGGLEEHPSAEDAISAADEAFAARTAERSILGALRRRPPPTLAGELDAALRARHIPVRTYSRPSRRPPRGEIVQRGTRIVAKQPRVVIYVDRSGSFTPEKTADAEVRLSRLLRLYRASVRADVLEFGSGQLATRVCHGGNTPYELVAEHIVRERPAIAIVITDDDPCPTLPSMGDIRVIVVPVGSTTSHFPGRIVK